MTIGKSLSEGPARKPANCDFRTCQFTTLYSSNVISAYNELVMEIATHMLLRSLRRWFQILQSATRNGKGPWWGLTGGQESLLSNDKSFEQSLEY